MNSDGLVDCVIIPDCGDEDYWRPPEDYEWTTTTTETTYMSGTPTFDPMYYDSECGPWGTSNDMNLGYDFYTIEDCYDACENEANMSTGMVCEWISYNNNPQSDRYGECYWEMYGCDTPSESMGFTVYNVVTPDPVEETTSTTTVHYPDVDTTGLTACQLKPACDWRVDQ